MTELNRELNRGKSVVVYFRDDWWDGFDQLEAELLTRELTVALYRNDAVIMVANETLRNPQVEKELRRISGTNKLPAVAIYSPDKSAKLLEDSIDVAGLVSALNQITK